MGDFNFEPQGEEYARFTGPWSKQHGRVAPLDGFVDSWTMTGHDEGEGITCDGKRIDYIFVSSSLAERIQSTRIDSEAQGSDHQPYWCDIRL